MAAAGLYKNIVIARTWTSLGPEAVIPALASSFSSNAIDSMNRAILRGYKLGEESSSLCLLSICGGDTTKQYGPEKLNVETTFYLALSQQSRDFPQHTSKSLPLPPSSQSTHHLQIASHQACRYV